MLNLRISGVPSFIWTHGMILVNHCEDWKHTLCEEDAVVVQSWTFYCQIQQDQSCTASSTLPHPTVSALLCLLLTHHKRILSKYMQKKYECTDFFFHLLITMAYMMKLISDNKGSFDNLLWLDCSFSIQRDRERQTS